ncbi:GNAT family N-acetyltransferase [Pseudorhodoferax sp. Leaf267]|uniref:GNAT family N-acetyltransferase n=1 Tax=Pseudorhodoferax sp. Leaf267 TaxID=1736316 RepID=UPI000700B3C7|nr:GNAT family protein [Pseudorhodoferax sp. Leaf267]KQP20548.1 GCN5 family acetyltransferase [Pseudorhodoferax sp. Leaf267]
MARFIDSVTLAGRKIALLEPMRLEHADELLEAARDGELWELWYTSVGGGAGITDYVESALRMRDEHGALPFTVRRQEDGKVVGSTRFFNVDEKNRRLEIGHTWYSQSMQRTALNTECKLVLLEHAFEKLNCIAVEFRTHWFNFDSRAAIARLGAKQDGVLRNHQIMPNGTLRDTVVFSIIQSEWPTVKAHLRWQLKKPRA